MSLETSTHYAFFDDPPPFPFFMLIALAFLVYLASRAATVYRQHCICASYKRPGPVLPEEAAGKASGEMRDGTQSCP